MIKSHGCQPTTPHSTFASASATFVALCATALTVSTAKVAIAAPSTDADTLKIAGSKEIESLDPALVDGADANLVAQGLYEGLVVSDPKTLEPRPGAAESWKLSPNGLTLTFKLRAGQKWSDGKPLTAADFVASWERALSAENGAYYASFFDDVVGAEAFRKAKTAKDRDFAKVGMKAEGEGTLKVTLARPAPYFLGLLSQPVFAPIAPSVRAALAKGNKGVFSSPDSLVTNGPFRLAEWKLKDHLTLVKNESYHDAKSVALSKIVVMPVEDSKTALNLYEAGEVQWIRRVPLAQIASLRASRKDFHVERMLNTVYLRFNTTRGAFKDARVRRAIAMALDRKIIADKVAREGQEPAYTFVTTGLPGYSSSFKIEENVEKARALLAEAGFPGGKGFPPTQALFISDEQSKNVITAVSVMLKKNLGIDIGPRNLERGVYYDALDALNYDIARSSYTAKFLDAKSFLDKFTSDNTYNNLTGYKNPAFDALLEKADGESDPAKRNAHFAAAEKVLVGEDAVLVPLYFNTSINMWKDGVAGLHTNVLDVHPLKAIRLTGALAKK